MMSSLTLSGLRRKTSFGASSSSSPSLEQGIEVIDTRRLDGESKTNENRDDIFIVGNVITSIDEEVPVEARTPQHQTDSTQRAELVRVASHSMDVPVVLAPPSQHQVEVEPRASIIFEVGKEDEDEGWRCFYIALSALVVAGVIAAIVVSIVTRNNLPEDAR